MAIGFYLYVHVHMCVTTIIKEEVIRLRGREGGREEWRGRVWGGNNVTIVLVHEILEIIIMK